MPNSEPIYLSPKDFEKTLEGYVAYSLTFFASVRCGTKQGLLDLANHEAQNIIAKVREHDANPGVTFDDLSA